MPAKKKAVEAAPVETVVAYKGFDQNLKCRNFQFEVGKTYEHTGKVVACQSGFHACENPMDVLSYYGLGDGNRFARVTLAGELSRHGGDSKIAAAKLTVDAELTLPAFIGTAVKWMIDTTSEDAKVSRKKEDAASGNYSRQAASGDSSRQAASGNYSRQAASGNYSQQAASGNYSRQAASGDSSRQAASGNYSRQAASGDSSRQAASGNYSQQAASGNYSQQAASGNYSQLAASGDSSQLAASGDSSQLAASGDSSQLAASGYNSRQELNGAHSAAAGVGPGALIKGVEGSCIAICEWLDGKPVGFVTGIIGQDGLKADTWYRAEGGKLVEASQ